LTSLMSYLRQLSQHLSQITYQAGAAHCVYGYMCLDLENNCRKGPCRASDLETVNENKGSPN